MNIEMNRASALPDTVFFVGIGQAPVPLFIAFCSLREQLRNAQCFFSMSEANEQTVG
ncbi:MAG: hypothetical protein SO122_03125 [Eubacteriales bacterium]|nr:hypothetical protein [Eubacteriales bacterium]